MIHYKIIPLPNPKTTGEYFILPNLVLNKTLQKIQPRLFFMVFYVNHLTLHFTRKSSSNNRLFKKQTKEPKDVFTTRNGNSQGNKRGLLQMVQSQQESRATPHQSGLLLPQARSKQKSGHVGSQGPQEDQEAHRKIKHHQVGIWPGSSPGDSLFYWSMTIQKVTNSRKSYHKSEYLQRQNIFMPHPARSPAYTRHARLTKSAQINHDNNHNHRLFII